MSIFDVGHEETLLRARSRNLRPELPNQFGNVFPWPSSFGPTVAPVVSDLQVMGLPAAWRAINLVANGLAMMAPLDVYEDDELLVKVAPRPSIADRPNVTMTSHEFWFQAAAVALCRGQYIALHADFDPSTGYPNQVVPVPIGFAHPYYDTAGYTVYEIAGELYSSEQVTHVRWLQLPGSPRGIGPVEIHRRALGSSLEMQHLKADTYARGSVPSGIIEVPIPNPDKTQMEDVQTQWIDNHGMQHRPAVLPQDWKFIPLTFSPVDAQFLEAMQYGVAETAFIFGLDPTDLNASLSGGSASITYANIEQRQIARTTDAYGPWMNRFEQAWADLLPGRQVTRFDPNRLMRTDALTTARVHALNIDTGVETDDEARAMAGRPPLTPAQREQRAAVKPAPIAPNAAAIADASMNTGAEPAGDNTEGTQR